MKRIKIVEKTQPVVRDTGPAQQLVDPAHVGKVLEADEPVSELRWYRVIASVHAASPEEAEAIVARALPPKHNDEDLAPSHVNTVEKIRWYRATVLLPPPQQSWCTAVLGASPDEVRSILERGFSPDQIRDIVPLVPEEDAEVESEGQS